MHCATIFDQNREKTKEEETLIITIHLRSQRAYISSQDTYPAATSCLLTTCVNNKFPQYYIVLYFAAISVA